MYRGILLKPWKHYPVGKELIFDNELGKAFEEKGYIKIVNPDELPAKEDLFEKATKKVTKKKN